MDLNQSSMEKLTLNERLQALNIRYHTLVCLLASIDVLGPLATDAHLPSLPEMTSDLKTSPAWIQFSVLSYSFILAISSLIGGYLSDKYGRRPITIFGLIFFIIGGYGCSFTPNIFILNASRIIQGFGGGISSIITSSVARDVFLANERMKILGILGTLRPFAIALAPMFGGWIAEISSYSWRMVFFVTTSIAVLVIIMAITLLPETKEKFFVRGESDSNSSQLNANEKQSIIQIVCNDCILLTMSFIIAFRMVAVFVFLNEMPYVVHHVYGYKETVSGMLIGAGAIFLVIGASVSIAMGKKGRKDSGKLGKVPISTLMNQMRVAAICALISCIFLIFGPILNHWNDVINNDISFYDLYTNNDWYFIVIPFCILTFSQGLNGPPSNVIVLEPYPHIAGIISSILTFWRLILPTIVMIILTQIVGHKTDHIASNLIFVIMAIMGFLCFVMMFCGPCLSKKNVAVRMSGSEHTISWNPNKNNTTSSQQKVRLLDDSLLSVNSSSKTPNQPINA